MGSITLDDRDRAILGNLAEGERGVDALADDVAIDLDYLRERLPELADNGLVDRVGDDAFALTESGKQVVVTSSAAASDDEGTPVQGTLDDRIDTPPDVEEALAALSLRPDWEAAVRGVYAFLHYWGMASAGEIIDAIYSEHPAGFAASETWWTECVRPGLASLPTVDPPDSDDWLWRFDGVPTVERDGEDGRDVLDAGALWQSSARYVVDELDRSADERTAVRAAFDILVREGTVGRSTLAETLYPEYDAGYDSSDQWWEECLAPALEALPGVERTGDRVQYRPTDTQ